MTDTPRRRGRPATGSDPHHSLRMPDERWAALEEAAQAVDLNRSALINQLAAWWLREPNAKMPPRPTADSSIS